MMRRLLWVVAAVLALLVVVPGALIGWQLWQTEDVTPSPPVADRAQQIALGASLARAGNCIGCHTARGGAAYAGGRALATEFGLFYAPNITPDAETGIGRWRADDFWRAMHHGRGRDGRFLYPAFPYQNYTRMTRADVDALFAYLQSLPPVAHANTAHALRFPYDQRLLLGLWRTLYFTPGQYEVDRRRSAQWNRGAYLVQGPGHCAGCHSARNLWGAPEAGLNGGIVPGLQWYAPPLHGGQDALGGWDEQQLRLLLKTGVSRHGAVFGPMAEVVGSSLQYLPNDDIAAMVSYLTAQPATAPRVEAGSAQPDGAEAERIMKLGRKLYGDLCVDCHQANGRGIAPDYPPLAGNRAVSSGPAANAIRLVLNGGYPPSTAGNPYPFGMPPFGPRLTDQEVAALVSYIRNSWGHHASFVSAAEVNRYRAVPMD